MTPPRFFVHLWAETADHAREKASQHGTVVDLRLHAATHDSSVYGSAEVEAPKAEEGTP